MLHFSRSLRFGWPGMALKFRRRDRRGRVGRRSATPFVLFQEIHEVLAGDTEIVGGGGAVDAVMQTAAATKLGLSGWLLA